MVKYVPTFSKDTLKKKLASVTHVDACSTGN